MAETLQALLMEGITRFGVTQARLDLERFIADPQPLETWFGLSFQTLGQRISML